MKENTSCFSLHLTDGMLEDLRFYLCAVQEVFLSGLFQE